MGIIDADISTRLGFLDDAAFSDGDPYAAHTLRTLSRTANRFLARGGPVLVLPFSTVAESRRLIGIGRTRWVPLLRSIVVPKKPGIVKYRVGVQSKLGTAGDRALIQVTTRACPFSPTARGGDPNVLELDTKATWAATLLADVPADPGATDEIGWWICGEPTARLMSTGTYGSPNSNYASSALGDMLYDATATWNTGTDSPGTGGHAVHFVDSSGDALGPWHSLYDAYSCTHLRVDPPFDSDEQRRYNRFPYNLYEIVQLPRVTIGGLSVYAQDRTA